VKGTVAGVGLMAEYLTDQRKFHGRTGGAVDEDLEDDHVMTALDVEVNYKLGGFTPWLAYKTFDWDQGDADADGNVYGAQGTDNGTSITVGATCDVFGKSYEPYLAIVMEQGTYLKGTDTEDLQNMMVKFGARGAF